MPLVLPMALRPRLLLMPFAAIPGAPPNLAGPTVADATRFRIPPAVRTIVGALRHIELPPARRRRNWTGPLGQGACVHAAIVHLLHWQEEHALADWWEHRYGDGESASGLSAKLNGARLRFAETRE